MAYEFVLWRQRSSEEPTGFTSGCRMLPRALTRMSAASSLEGFWLRWERRRLDRTPSAFFFFSSFVARQAVQINSYWSLPFHIQTANRLPAVALLQTAAFFLFCFFLITFWRNPCLFNDWRSAGFALCRDSKKYSPTRTKGTECSVQCWVQKSGEKCLFLLRVFFSIFSAQWDSWNMHTTHHATFLWMLKPIWIDGDFWPLFLKD